MLIPRILQVDTTMDATQQGQLIGSSWPFAVQTFKAVEPSLVWVETNRVATRTAAGEDAEQWARQKRGYMALVYHRRTGVVLAQYCQTQDGILGFLLYTPHGRLEGQHNAHLFEPLPGSVTQEPDPGATEGYARLPFVETAPICTYPVTDDAGRTQQEWWYAQRPSNSGLWLSVYPDRPTDTEEGGEDPVFTVIIEVYGGELRLLWRDRENLEGDPHILVIESDLADIPLTRLAVLHQIGTEKA
jgi:hypothetical protein